MQCYLKKVRKHQEWIILCVKEVFYFREVHFEQTTAKKIFYKTKKTLGVCQLNSTLYIQKLDDKESYFVLSVNHLVISPPPPRRSDMSSPSNACVFMPPLVVIVTSLLPTNQVILRPPANRNSAMGDLREQSGVIRSKIMHYFPIEQGTSKN